MSNMSKEIVNVKYCILGYGYASLIAYHKILKNNDHDDVLILQSKEAKQIFTLEHQNFQFSPLPIFPVKESKLYNSDLFDDVAEQKPIMVSFSKLKNFDYSTFKIKEGSLADFMVKAQGVDKNLCLGAKQWGEEMFTVPFSQVQSKIERHYVNPKGNTRIGYINGKSLFKYAIDKLNPNVLNYLNIEYIDVKEKEVHLNDSILHYEQLISTLPIHKLLKLCSLEYYHDTSYAGCKFHFFTHDGDFKENQMIYDCDYHSDIIRIFSISNNFLMVQLNSKKRNSVISNIEDRVQELAPNISGLSHVRKLYVPMCYPTELILDKSTLDSIACLKKNDIIPFGRFGNWEYSDLHELDWSIID